MLPKYEQKEEDEREEEKEEEEKTATNSWFSFSTDWNIFGFRRNHDH